MQGSAFGSPRERAPLEGCEREALSLLPAYFWDLSFKELPVILGYLKVMDSHISIIHKWIIHLGD